jgi:hypothetical protein
VARSRTLAELRDEVRQRADCENDPHVTNTELTRYLNQSCAALHAIMVEADEGEFIEQADLVTVAGVELLALDTLPVSDEIQGLYKLAHVEATVNGIVRELGRWTWERYTAARNASTWALRDVPLSYRLVRNKLGVPSLQFAPAPDGAYPIRVHYITPFIDMVADSDVYDGRDGWEEWVVWDAAMKCLVKEESSLADARTERDAVMARIKPQIDTPDRDHPPTVRDTEGADLGWGAGWYGR